MNQYSDPLAPSVILSAAQWIEGTLLGTLATTVAIVAVAAIGFEALTGRVDFRRAGRMLLGCFILFGATSIVGGLRQSTLGQPLPTMTELSETRTLEPSKQVPPYDPYAGAALRRTN